MKRNKRIHIIGTHGIPASYGGFETLTENLCRFLGNDVDITVYCYSKLYPQKNKQYLNAKLVYIPVYASGMSGIIYDFISYVLALVKSDVILFLGPAGSGIITPLRYFFGKKVITNHGGFEEWNREKLNLFKQKWAWINHWVAAKTASLNVADNFVYQKSIMNNFHVNSEVIKYGSNHVYKTQNSEDLFSKYPFVKERYAVSVSRAQVDNNLHLVLSAFENFSDYKLVLVSNWNVSEYGKTLKEKYNTNPNIILLDAIYNLDELNFIRGNAYVYIHSHSRCGTAPSLIEAMNLKLPVLSLDIATNRETTNNEALYFSDANDLEKQLKSLNEETLAVNASAMYAIVEKEFKWEKVSADYLNLFLKY